MGYLDNETESIEQRSDEEILALSIGSPSIFRYIVERYEEAFLRKVRHILGNREEVEDIVQETFTKIYVHAKRYKVQPGASFKSWAYRILINTTFTYYQKLKKKDNFFATLDDEIWAIIPDLSADTVGKEGMRDAIASVISRMPKSLGNILTMHFLQDKSQKEIADDEGLTVSAVKTRIHRAKKEFRKINETTARLE
jgi:RNA polymerase sigma-70 factor (ECF subfamily)